MSRASASRPRTAAALACRTDLDVPGCDTGPSGRLGFVLREARAAWRSHRTRTTTASSTTTDTVTHIPPDDRTSATGARRPL